MKLHDLLRLIQDVAVANNLSSPFVCGGVPRDRVRGETKELHDIDLTSLSGDSVNLAFACSKVVPYGNFIFFDDGHCCLKIGNLKIDFSNHFIIPGIDKELDRLGIEDKTPIMREMYSRDFTINSLLQDLNFEKIYDLTQQGIKDIKAGVIRCPINPELTISNDPKRILRALKFALRFDYLLDAELIKAIKKYKHLLKNLSPEYVKERANELLKFGSEKALKLMIEFDLLNYIPLTKQISDELIKHKLLYYAF